MSWENLMRFVAIAGKLVNIENINYINHRTDSNTGKVYCLYVFDEKTVLEEVYESCEAFENALLKYGILEKKTEEIHKLKNLCIMGIDILKKTFSIRR
jgi:hypothetical protein